MPQSLYKIPFGLVFFSKSDAQISNTQIAQNIAFFGNDVFFRSNTIRLYGQIHLIFKHFKKRYLCINRVLEILFILFYRVLNELAVGFCRLGSGLRTTPIHNRNRQFYLQKLIILWFLYHIRNFLTAIRKP